MTPSAAAMNAFASTALSAAEREQHSVQADLVAVLVAVTGGQPRILTTQGGDALPAGPFTANHRSLQASLRAWVETQTHHPLGFVEQLYTFADRDRSQEVGMRAISISYLALTRELDNAGDAQPGWQDWYRYFPWEDWRNGAPALLSQCIAPALRAWSDGAPEKVAASARWERVSVTFGLEGCDWNEELVLQRYELLFEAGLVAEARRDGVAASADRPLLGLAMRNDHRRILATGMARLRAKIKYRPVVYELMADSFSLLQLQQTVEALAGRSLHKQNFRRLIEQQALVEDTGHMSTAGAGRPAKLFRFRRNVLMERAIAGNKLPLARS
ncbi:hypothetical protein HNP33_001115 [Comamonas odontotermitis]|uniref:NrtR DNA-binding winged helix domain-containing protein n=2 Tax=Comamonas odontotermitis TaxID=379895 RepID=A0ABR6RD59_9BURK|nr:hypothetical protein [Comamonas odontotermitis]